MSVPSAPQIVIRPRATDQTLQFYWAAPVSDGGSPIIGYVIECPTVPISDTLSPTASYYSINGLTNYQDYTFTIYAYNSNGNGATATFRTVQPGFAPAAPTDVSATLLDGSSVQVTWTNPVYSGRLGWNVIKAIPQEGGTTVVFATYGYRTDKTVGGGFDYTKTYRFLVQGVTDTGYAPPTSLSQIIDFSPGGGVATMVAGGTQFAPNALAYSTDNGLTWTPVATTVFTKDVNGVAYNGYLWVAVGEGVNSIAMSPDGVNWTPLGQSIFSAQGTGVAWNGSVFVATGQGVNTLAYSYDGDTWVGLGTTMFGTIGNTVAWNGHMFVAGGDSGTNTLAWSTDGIHWIGLGTSIFPTGGCKCLAWNGSRWAAGSADTNEIAYSDDGINWTQTTAGLSDTCNSIAWNGEYWLAVGSTGPDSMAYSTDASNWTVVANGDISNNALACIWNGTQWFVGSDTGIWSTTDISGTWTHRSSTFWTQALATKIQLPYVVKYVASGTTSTLCYSSDARIWSAVQSPPSFERINSFASGYDVCGESLFVACGKGTNHFAKSYDGVNWTTVSFMTGGSPDCRAAACGNFLSGPVRAWIAVGNDASDGVYYSPNDFTTPISLGPVGLTTKYAVAYGRDVSGKSLWLIGGYDPSGCIARGPTEFGTTEVPPSSWTVVGSGQIETCYGLGWNGRRWVAVGAPGAGTDSIMVSDDDGITWTGLGTGVFSTRGNAVACNGSVWVAVGAGTNTIAYSQDGTSWTGLGTQYAHVEAKTVAWQDYQWVISCTESSGNTIFTSTDGRVWTGRGNQVDLSGNAVMGRDIPPYTTPEWIVSGLPYNPNPGITSLTTMVSYDLSGTTFRGNEYKDATIGNSYATGIRWNGTEWSACNQFGLHVSKNAIQWRESFTRLSSVYTPQCFDTDGSMYVTGSAGDASGNIAYSFDGKKWIRSPTLALQNTGLNIYSIAAGEDTSGNRRWAALGQDTSDCLILRSSDGINWTTATMPFWLVGSLQDTFTCQIAYGYDSSGNSRWVAATTADPSGNGILSSPDAITWSTTTPIPLGARRVQYNNRRWVALTDVSDIVYTSEDGIHWVSQGQEIWGAGVLPARDVRWNGRTWLGIANNSDQAFRSVDDISWNQTSATFGMGALFSVGARNLSQPEVRWIVTGGASPYLFISPDGINYTGVLATPFDAPAFGIAYGKDASGQRMWLAGSRGTTKLASSPNGIQWTGIAGGSISRVYAICYGQDLSANHVWAVGGWDTVSPTNTLAIYKDGTVTTLGASIFTGQVNTIAYGYDTSGVGIFIAVGSGTNTLAWSRDAFTWTGLGTSTFSTSGLDVVFNGERFVAVGEGTNTIATSVDGIHWTGQGTTIFGLSGYSITWSGVRFVASGSSGGYETAVSSDGLTWKKFDSSNESMALATDGNVYVSANDSTPFLGVSYDGVNWSYPTTFASYLFGVATNQFILPLQTRRT